MGWNPQFNFKLRDDEITFGNLIVDKRCVDLLSKALVKIKNGENVDISVIKNILDVGCYTDIEFEKIHTEFEEVKKDIAYFKQLCSANLISGISNWAKRMDTNIGYIVGSNTWVEKYKELKLCACEMYIRLIGKGFEFPPEQAKVYRERYGEIMNTTDSKERLAGVLRKQYYEDRDNGVPNAEEIYIQAQLDNGLLTPEQAEKHSRLFGAVAKAKVEKDLTADMDKVIIPGEVIGALRNSAEGVYKKQPDEVGVYVDDTTREEITLTARMIADKVNEMLFLSDKLEQAICYTELFEVVASVCRDINIDTTKTSEVVTAFYDKSKGVTAGEVIDAVSELFKTIFLKMNATMFDSVEKTVDKEYWDNIVKGKKSYNECGENQFHMTADSLKNKMEEIKGISDIVKRVRACISLLQVLGQEFDQRDLKWPELSSETIAGFSDSSMSFGQVVANVQTIVNEVTSEENAPVIDNGKFYIDKKWWDNLCNPLK